MIRDRGPSQGVPLAIAAVLVSMIAQIGVGALAKGLFPLVGATGVATLRITFAALTLLAVWRPWRFALGLRDGAAIAVYGTSLGAMNLLFFLSIDRIPLGISIGIQFAGPLGVALAGSRSLPDFAWILLAVTGLACLLPVVGAGDLDPLGVVCAVLGGLCWAFYILFGRRAGLLNGGQAVSLGMVAAALVVAPFGVAAAGEALAAPSTLLVGLGIALMSSAVPYSLEMAALRRLDGRVYGILMSLQPALGALIGIALLDETLTAVQWAGIACIVAASCGVTLGRRSRTSAAAATRTADP